MADSHDIELEALHPYGNNGAVGDGCTLAISDLEGDVGERVTIDEDKQWYFTVMVQGDVKRPKMITIHDVGLNSESCFGSFFNYPQMEAIRKGFCVYHLTLPGQEPTATSMGAGYVYPTMEELSEMLASFVSLYNIDSFIGFGVGLGANVLVRYAMGKTTTISHLPLTSPPQTTTSKSTASS